MPAYGPRETRICRIESNGAYLRERVTDFLPRIGPSEQPGHPVRFETPPGHQVRLDFEVRADQMLRIDAARLSRALCRWDEQLKLAGQINRDQPMSDKFRSLSVIAGVAMTALLVACEPAAAAPSLPLKGTYQCFTTSWVQTGIAPDARDQDERKKRGMNPLESGDYAVSIPAPMGMMMMPAVFGEIRIDGNGRYSLPQMNQSGRYTFDAAKNDLQFTGDLGAMSLHDFNPETSSFVLIYKSELAFQCGIVGTASVGGEPAPSRPAAPTAPPPANFNGVFAGTLSCDGASAPLTLTLTDTGQSRLSGSVKRGSFGAGTPARSYGVEGNRSTNTFSVTPDFASILSQSGASLLSLSGQLSGDTLNAKVDAPGCAAFTATRQ